MTKMRVNWPDVIVLDIEMPRMDGMTFLRQIMVIRPTPVVIGSSMAECSTAVTMEALAAGAVGIITKPVLGIRDFLQDNSVELIAAIRVAAQARLCRTYTDSCASGVNRDGGIVGLGAQRSRSIQRCRRYRHWIADA